MEHNRLVDRGPHEPSFPKYRAISAATTLRGPHNLIGASSSGGAFTITLGSNLARAKAIMVIKDVGGAAAANNITIATEGAELIDGAATYVLNANYESISLFSNGTNFFVFSGHLE